MVEEQRKTREINVITFYDDILSARLIHKLRFVAQGGLASHFDTDILDVTALRQSAHRARAVGVGKERKCAVLDLFHIDRCIRYNSISAGSSSTRFSSLIRVRSPAFSRSFAYAARLVCGIGRSPPLICSASHCTEFTRFE
jgi:hypothetical protein